MIRWQQSKWIRTPKKLRKNENYKPQKGVKVSGAYGIQEKS